MADVRHIVATKRAESRSDWDVATRRFLCWLSSSRHSRSAALVQVLAGADVKEFAHAEISQMMLSALRAWTSDLTLSGSFRPLTVSNHGRSVAAVLEALGELPRRPLLRFKRHSITMPQHVGVTYSLGALDWPEVEGLEGAARERRCLDIVLQAAMREFAAREAWFLFGQSVLASTAAPAGVDGLAWGSVKTLLTHEHRFWTAEGRSQFCRSGDCPSEVQLLTSNLAKQKTWLAAGLPPAAAQLFSWRHRTGYPAQRRLANLAISCLGATRMSTWPAIVAFCCETGWNYQPIRDLPAEPFLLRTATEHGLATSAFVASFKNRAGHGVLAHLEQGRTLPALVEEEARAAWRATVDAYDQSGRQDGYLMLRPKPEAALLGLLDRFRVMADAMRNYDRRGQHRDRFCWWLTPLYDLVVSTVLSSTKLFADDTTLPVLDPGRGRTKTGRLWCYAVDDRPWCGPGHPAAAYAYSEDRKGERPAGHLAGFRGVLQVDGYAGFKRLAGDRKDGSVTLAFCWAHMRRRFYEQRKQARQERSRPVVEALHAWLQDHVGRVSAASGLAEAIRYAIRHWPGLVVFLDDGRVEMDTNPVERAIRPIALNRKNTLFAGSDGGARHWAVAMTLIQTAKLNGREPMAYLTDVLQRIVSGQTKAHELHTLLPWAWTPKAEAAALPQPATIAA